MSATRMGRSDRALAFNERHMGELAGSVATDYSRGFFAGWAQTRIDYQAARDRQDTAQIIVLGERLAAYQDEFHRTAF